MNIYRDGTVQVSTGGTEMGQGLNTKIGQIVADAFAIPIEDVRVMPASTEKIANTSPTAASATTDLNGTAALRACETLRERLAEAAAPHLASTADGIAPSPAHVRFGRAGVFDVRRPGRFLAFRELVRIAYEDRVDLGARGFYATPGVDFNRETGRGNPFLYFTCGAAVSEVEVDRLTGELAVRRVDILIDLGRPLNPAIDRGAGARRVRAGDGLGHDRGAALFRTPASCSRTRPTTTRSRTSNACPPTCGSRSSRARRTRSTCWAARRWASRRSCWA